MKDIFIILFICTFSIQLWIGETAQFPQNDANGLLERSQGASAFAMALRGHARNHVIGLVEGYSSGNTIPTTAFENNADQNEVMRRMILSPIATHEINLLNKAMPEYLINPHNIPLDKRRREPYFRLADLGYNYKNKPAPYVRRFQNGIQVGGRVRMVGAKLVLAHKAGKQQDETAEVLVYTMHPVAPR